MWPVSRVQYGALRWASNRIINAKLYIVTVKSVLLHTLTASVFFSFQIKPILTGKDAVWTSTSIVLMCPINSPNEDKLAYYASPSPTRTVDHRTRREFWLQRPSPSPSPSRWTCSSSISVRLPEAYCTVVSSLLDLPKRQRAKCKVHTSTNCWTSRRGKEPSTRFYRSRHPSRSILQL